MDEYEASGFELMVEYNFDGLFEHEGYFDNPEELIYYIQKHFIDNKN